MAVFIDHWPCLFTTKRNFTSRKLGLNPIPTGLGHLIPPLAGRNRVKKKKSIFQIKCFEYGIT